MIALSVAAAAGVICRAMENGERTPAGWAAALEAACMLQTPETAQRLMRAEQRRAELEAVLGSHRKDDQAEIGRLKARIAELEAAPRERTVDEDPIAFALTDKAEAVRAEYLYCGADSGRTEPPYTCERRIAHKGPCGIKRDPDEDVTPQVRRLRNLLAGQRAEAGERP